MWKFTGWPGRGEKKGLFRKNRKAIKNDGRDLLQSQPNFSLKSIQKDKIYFLEIDFREDLRPRHCEKYMNGYL